MKIAVFSTKHYDEEFKRSAVDLLLSHGKALKPMAQDLGVSPVTLRKWRDERLASMEPSADGKTPREMAEEIRKLARENELLRRQREILKKALSILSDPSSGGMP